MTYAEYLRGLLESFPGYVEKSQPNEPPYLCMVADACIVRLYRDYPKEFSSIERCHERFLKRINGYS